MKTITIDVGDLLTALSPDEVGRRIGEVPGVESVSVDHAAQSATVAYDETHIQVADIKSLTQLARSRRRRIACRLDRHGSRRPRHGQRITRNAETGVWSFRTPGP